MLSRPHVLVLFAAPLSLLAPLRAQMHKVEKPERVTRAIGVYEWTGDLNKPTAARLVPVSLFLDGHMEDAGVYLARPVPFALETGDIYSIETAGQPVGAYDLDFARDIITHHSADDASNAWYGYGRFHPPAAEKPPAKLAASAHPFSIVGGKDDSDDTPHFVVRHPNDNSPDTTDAKPGAKPDATTSNKGSASPVSDDDSDRPTLRHRDAPPDPKRNKKEKPAGYVTGPNGSLNDDPDRPTLHRGALEGEATVAPLTGLPANMHQSVAVSDPANHEPHVFTREWESRTEREQTLADFEKLARIRLAAYLTTNKLQPVAAEVVSTAGPKAAVAPPATHTSAPQDVIVEKPVAAAPVTDATTDASGNPIAPGAGDAPSLRDRTNPTSTPQPTPATAATPAATPVAPHKPTVATHNAHSRRPTEPTVLALTSEDLRGYELSYGALPTFVYTAQSPVAQGGLVYITLVAQRLPSGELQTALASVTDETHLDRVPWMRLVDAVDPDWSHRASLLFELRAQNSRQFALYRLVTAQAEQTFITGVIE
jgi:hypothetical protein